MSSILALSYRRHPWSYLFLFLTANSLLSYSQLSLQVKILVGILGVLLPLYVAFRTDPPTSKNEKPSYSLETLGPVPVWILILGLGLAVFERLYKLETLFCWPTLDEGWNGISAIELSRHWSWKFFYTFGQAPPLPVWCAAFLMKHGCNPAFSLWFPSAMVSLLTVAAAYIAARQFFSRSFSLICGALFAFSYWPLFIGRFCHQGIWLPFWVCLVAYFWGGFQKSGNGGSKRYWALGLGFFLGLGSFTFTPWLAVAGIFFLFFVWNMVIRPGKDRSYFLFFFMSFLFSLIPFLVAVHREGYGQHLLSLSPWGGWFHHFDFFFNLFRYFSTLVWAPFDPEPAYTPLWGGFLDPLLGAFFFIGFIEMYRLRTFRLIPCIGVAFLAFLFPGALSPNVESFRTAQILPLVLFITTLGITAFLSILPQDKRRGVFLGLFLLVAILDFYLLASPYRDPDTHPENFGRPVKSLERYRAYQLLNELQRSNGPGLVLASFETDSFNDPTLSLMTYPFNAAGNSDLLHEIAQKKEPPKWTAVFVNNHYQPFLQKRFPEGKWYSVSKEMGTTDGGYLLGIIPITPGNYQTLFSWMAAHVVFESADRQRFFQSDGSIQTSLRVLDASRPLTKSDPFLESLYWDKRAAYEYVGLDYDQQLYSYQMAVKEGYPTADLYFKLGELLRVKGRLAEAQKAYFMATQAPLDLTPSAQILAALKSQTLPKK